MEMRVQALGGTTSSFDVGFAQLAARILPYRLHTVLVI